MEGLAYRNSPTLFRTVPSSTPYGLLFPKIGGSQPPHKTPIAIISGTGKATNFRFGPNILRVHPNKTPLKILEKRERGHIQGLPNFLGTPIISGTGKATNFKFCAHIYRLNRNKSPLKISGKVAVGVVRDSRKFSGTVYRAHRAVIFAIAQLSCQSVYVCQLSLLITSLNMHDTRSIFAWPERVF